MMKKSFLLLSIQLFILTAFAQTVFTYGNNAVSKDEFLRAFNKNNSAAANREKSIREYLDLYSNFKLKVKAAEELRLDTLPQIVYDIANFRQQVIENYMSDEKGSAKLMEEAFIRSQKDLHVQHLSINIDASAKPEDTLLAYKNIMDACEALKRGETNNESINDKYKVRSGDLGFITVFSVPYQYENILYALRPGQVSKPFRSKNAWHIFKLIEERKSIGKWKVAQILFTYPPNAPEETKNATMKKADSVYGLLKSGADFTRLVKEFSDDKLTYMKGGELPEFGTGRYDYGFENEVTKLKADNDITKPFTTEYGVHIVKRIAFAETPAEKDNAGLQFELKQKLMQDSRMNEARESFSTSVVSLIGYKKLAIVKDVDLFRYADSISNSTSQMDIDQFPISKKKVLMIKENVLKGADWLNFVKDYKTNPEQYNGESNTVLWNKFITYSAMEYYKQHLENYNADFRYQMNEFKEGNMLFEIMERNVWSKAASDTTGLLNQYNANKTKYKWAPSAEVLIFNCSNEKLANETMKAIMNGKKWKEISDSSEGSIQADSGRYEIAQITDPSSHGEPAGNSYSSVIKNSDGTATFVKYIKIYPADQQRSFEEARGLVINDYQTVLEKKWLESLRKKYPVKINEAVVREMIH